MKKRKTKATTAWVVRSRSKETRRERKENVRICQLIRYMRRYKLLEAP